MNKRIFACTLLLLNGLLMSNPSAATEEPKYEVIKSEGAFEIRRYKPMLIAETEVQGDMDEASRKGFRLIADYIFGNNQRPDSADEAKIAMTAPVTVQPQAVKIAMTAPVSAQPVAGATNMQTADKWRVHFVMPSQYTLATIAKPKNDAVKLKEVPGKYFVVLAYSGLNGVAKVQEKTNETLEWTRQNGLEITGIPQLARYDPPWTLPMFRRNEIMVEVATPKQ
ncbi:MAG: heme-binding protein [Burkholderiales bacterium]|nr:heme-binding protein [Burkholderiales bacterium]